MKSFVGRLASVGAAIALAASVLGFATGPASAAETEQASAGNGIVFVGKPSGDDVGILDCSHSHSVNSNVSGTVVGDGVNMRQGPHLYCDSNGLAYLGNNITWHCWRQDGTAYTWTWGVNHSRGISGWVRRDHVTGTGYVYHC